MYLQSQKKKKMSSGQVKITEGEKNEPMLLQRLFHRATLGPRPEPGGPPSLQTTDWNCILHA